MAELARKAKKYLSPELKSAFGVIDAVKPENLPALRAILRSLFPKLKPHRLAQFTQKAAEHLGDIINKPLEGAKTTMDQIAAMREIASDQSTQADRIRGMYQAFSTQFPEDAQSAQEVQAKQTLRSRYDLPGPDDFKETMSQVCLHTHTK